MKWRVGSKIPLNVYEGDRPVCQCHSEEDARRIVQAMNAVPIINPTIDELELGTRAHNFFVSRLEQGNRDVAHALELRPDGIHNFGLGSFQEVIAELISAGIRLERIRGSVFWNSAPTEWKNKVARALSCHELLGFRI